MIKLDLLSLTRVTRCTQHSAFTDLIQWENNTLLCAFREAESHVSPAGKVILLQLSLDGSELARVELALNGYDLRDPKLMITPDNALCVTAYAKSYIDGETNRMCSWIGDLHALPPQPNRFGQDYWWLWHPVWHGDQAFGFAYRRSENRLAFWGSNLRDKINVYQKDALSLETHGLGYPNESAIWFVNNQCFAIVRRDADTGSSQFGHASPPYKKWQWQDIKEYIGGPATCPLSHITEDFNQLILVAGRANVNDEYNTHVWAFDLEKTKLIPLLTLPSEGDNGYPGMVLMDDTLYLSYYSSHQEEQTDVYLAKIAVCVN